MISKCGVGSRWLPFWKIHRKGWCELFGQLRMSWCAQGSRQPLSTSRSMRRGSWVGMAKGLETELCGYRHQLWSSQIIFICHPVRTGPCRARLMLSSKMWMMWCEYQCWQNKNDGSSGRRPSSKVGSVAGCFCLAGFIILDSTYSGETLKAVWPL